MYKSTDPRRIWVGIRRWWGYRIVQLIKRSLPQTKDSFENNVHRIVFIILNHSLWDRKIGVFV